MRSPHYTIGFITLESNGSYITQLWQGANDCAAHLGVSLITFGINEQATSLVAGAEPFYDHLAQIIDLEAVDGLLIWTAGILKDHTFAASFLARYAGIPMVSLGVDTPGVYRLLMDGYQGMFHLVSHLIERCNRRNLAFITGHPSNTEAQIRLQAYKDAVHYHGLGVRTDYIVEGAFDWNSQVIGQQAVGELLDKRQLQPDAIVASSDDLAIGVLQGLRQRGIRTPEMMSVTGFDNIPDCNAISPPLTTVAQPSYELAWQGIEMLLKLIQGEPIAECITLPTNVVVRRSCGADLASAQAATPVPARLATQAEIILPPLQLTTSEPGALKPYLQHTRGLYRQMLEAAFVVADGSQDRPLNGYKVGGYKVDGYKIEQILDGWMQAWLTKQANSLLYTVHQVLSGVREEGELLGWRRGILALLHHFSQAMNRTHATVGAAEHYASLSTFCLLLEKDLLLLFEQAAHTFTRSQQLENEHQSNLLYMISRRLLIPYQPEQLDEILVQELPSLGIGLAYVAVRTSLDISSDKVRLIAAYDPQRQRDAVQSGQHYRASDLATGRLILQGRSMQLLVVPLYTNYMYAGFAIFGVGPRRYQFYTQLASTLSYSLVNNLLLAQVRQHAEQLEANEQILRDSEQRLRIILEAIPDAVYRVNRAGVYTDHKPATSESHCFPQAIFKGKLLTQVLPADAAELMQNGIAAVLASGKLLLLEFALPDAASTTISQYEARLLPSGTDEVQIIMRDITSVKQEEEAALQAQKLESLGVLAGGIAHDFNNLLTGMLGQASLAVAKLARGLPVIDNIKKIMLSAEQATDLTRQLLAYTGKGKFQIDLLDMNQLIRNITELMGTALPIHANLHLRLQENLPPVQVDRTQIQQVVMNLFINAIEALSDGKGSITICTGTQQIDHSSFDGTSIDSTACKPGLYVVTSVSDTGIGMDQATLSRIFDPFFSTKPKGHGLGLSATTGIIRTHEGVLQVQSQPNVGTTFTMLLPASPLKQTTSEAVSIPTRLSARERQKFVLVIDDEAYARETATDILVEQGFQVLSAASGYEGIELFRSHCHNIEGVLLDLKMPGMSGQETCRHLHAIQPDLKVIFTSGYSESEVATLTRKSDRITFLPKPYTTELLTKRIYQMFHHDSAITAQAVLQP